MTVTICKERRMAMAHRLPYHDGKCREIHGHSYVVRVYVSGPVQALQEGNPQSGMVADFKVIGEFLGLVEEVMDHRLGNDTIDEYPTAERLAIAIAAMAAEELQPRLPTGVRVHKVRIYEEYVSPQSFAEVELAV